MNRDDALRLALEALENAQATFGEWWPDAIAAIREALEQPQQGCSECGVISTDDSMYALYCVECIGKMEQPQQEPVAHLWQHGETGRTRIVTPDMIVTADANWFVVGPLYLGAAPPQRQPLFPADLRVIDDMYDWQTEEGRLAAYRAIERKHGIGGEA